MAITRATRQPPRPRATSCRPVPARFAAILGVLLLRLPRLSRRPKHPLGDIVPPEILGGDVADDGLDGAVAGLAHDVEQQGAIGAGGGEQAAAERVAGEFFPSSPAPTAACFTSRTTALSDSFSR